MSALIKSGDGNAVRSFGLAPTAVAPEREADPRDAKIARLEAEIAGLREALATAETDAVEAIAEAGERGITAGLAKAEVREADRVDALRAGLSSVATGFEAKLAALETLAPQLACAALEKLFGAVDSWTPMVEAMLARQLAALRRSTIVSVHVSGADFADPGAVEALSGSALRAAIDPELRAGTARIECRLGQIDLDVRDGWSKLAKLLGEMAA
jgi:flagellar biosynthesis/type III secretory pathway protein FliH